MKKCLAFFIIMTITLGVNAQSNHQLLIDSLNSIKQALKANPVSTDLILKKAAIEMEMEDFDKALIDYNMILDANKKNPAALFFRAYANKNLKRYNFARVDYEGFLSIDPMNFEARLGLAVVNQEDKHFTEAMDQYNSLVEMFPDSATAYDARARFEVDRKMTDAAIYDWEEAIRLSPKNKDYHISRAESYLVNNNKIAAKDELDVAVKLGANRFSLVNMYQRCK